MLKARYGHKCLSTDDKTFAIGGYTNEKSIDEVEFLDMKRMKWNRTAPMLYPAVNVRAVVHNISIFVIFNPCKANSDYEQQFSRSLQQYNNITNKWYLKQEITADVTPTTGPSLVFLKFSLKLERNCPLYSRYELSQKS